MNSLWRTIHTLGAKKEMGLHGAPCPFKEGHPNLGSIAVRSQQSIVGPIPDRHDSLTALSPRSPTRIANRGHQ